MPLRQAPFVMAALLAAAPAGAQTLSPASPHALSASAIGGVSAGLGSAGAALGGTFAFDVTDRISVEARGLHIDRGSGQRGVEATGTMLLTLARTKRAAPYVAFGGGVYRAKFNMGDPDMFGMMDEQFAPGTMFTAAVNMPGFAVMGQGMEQFTTFRAAHMPTFYANRLGAMMVPDHGQWDSRTFTDPAATIGGGLTVNLTDRIYVRPDVRGLIIFSRGDRTVLTTMNVGLGVRF